VLIGSFYVSKRGLLATLATLVVLGLGGVVYVTNPFSSKQSDQNTTTTTTSLVPASRYSAAKAAALSISSNAVSIAKAAGRVTTSADIATSVAQLHGAIVADKNLGEVVGDSRMVEFKFPGLNEPSLKICVDVPARIGGVVTALPCPTN